MKILYIDAAAGASGDMLAGAMLDLGWPLSSLQKLVEQMGLGGEARISTARPIHAGIQACRLQVDVLGEDHEKHEHHDHPHNLHPHHDDHVHHHDHCHNEHKHSHKHDHAHHEQGHQHSQQRGLPDILALLMRLPQEVAAPAQRVFKRLAAAEARAHGIAENQVHFHEVGAVDSIVDIVAFCAALAWLQPDKIMCSPLPLGQGFVDCAHGRIPLPAPAVLNLLHDVPITGWPEKAETVTPTGAALLATLVDEFTPVPAFRLLKSGVGGGSRVSGKYPNLLRVLWGESDSALQLSTDEIVELSCNLDDQIPEDLPLLFERLMNAGALDVAANYLLMKKGRPGLRLNVLCPPSLAEELAAFLLEQSTSLGVRMQRKQRRLLKRYIETIDTPWGPVRVKTASLRESARRWHPEAEDVMAICRQTGLSPALVRQKIWAVLGNQE